MDILKEADRNRGEGFMKLTKPGDAKDEKMRLKQHLRIHHFSSIGLWLFYTLGTRGSRFGPCENIWTLAKKV